MKRYILILLCIWTVLQSFAQTLELNAPSYVEAGERFKIEYVLTNGDGSFQPPSSFPGFEVLGGPSVGRFSSTQIINGNVSSSSGTTYTYILAARKSGSYRLPAAAVSVGGKVVKSNSLTVTVDGSSAQSSQSGGQRGGGMGGFGGFFDDEDDFFQPVQPQRSSIGRGDVAYVASPSKRKVYEQEPVVMTYNVQFKPNLQISDFVYQNPDHKGFHTQKLEVPRTTQVRKEGNVCVAPLLKFLLLPQQSGTYTISSTPMECVARVRGSSVNSFFSGAQRVHCETSEVTIEVMPLPNKPANFSGGVGKFGISTKLLTTAPKTNDVATLRVTLSGSGNLSLVKAPLLRFPDSFDSYDAKMTDKTEASERGLSGEVYFDYTFVPREVGKYDIPAADFIYFDIDRQEYVTLHTDPIHLDVQHGKRSKEDVDAEMAIRNADIRDLHTGPAAVPVTEGLGASALWIGSPLYFVCLVALALAFSVIIAVLRRRANLNADVAGSRNRKARKKANKHLRKAEKALASADHNAFYGALSQALRGYFADKLTRDAAALTNETILAALAEKGVAADLVDQTKALLEDCDFARFAPAHNASQREKDLERASDLLNQIDQNIK